MRRGAGLPVLLSLLAADAVAVWLAFLLAYEVRFESGLIPYRELHPWNMYSLLGLGQSVATLLVFSLLGVYAPRAVVSWSEELQRVFGGVSIAAVLVMFVSAFVTEDFHFSEMLLALAWLLALLLILTAHALIYAFISLLSSTGVTEERLLIVGANELGADILAKIKASPWLGYRVVGFVAAGPTVEEFCGHRVLGDCEELGTIVRQYAVHEVIIGLPNLSHADALRLIEQCEATNVNLRIFPDVFQLMTSAVHISELGGLPLVSVRDVALKGYKLAIKRAMDLAVSATALVLFSPVMLLIALCVKLSSRDGGVFYSQVRVGLDGRPFRILKFRSMRPDAEVRSGPIWAQEGDRRTTYVGRLLRRFSLDELPQLINVLLGEMSLVGPRPERPYFVEQFKRQIPRYADRHREKAGMTGWAQVHGLRGNTPIEERTAYDLWYVENWTPWLDLKIMLRTVFVIFNDRNAY